jgi:hypothetical protein
LQNALREEERERERDEKKNDRKKHFFSGLFFSERPFSWSWRVV